MLASTTALKFIALLLFSSERNLANKPISLKHRCGGKAGKNYQNG
jgi:hypothetical protein